VEPEAELLGDEPVRLPRDDEHEPGETRRGPIAARRRPRVSWALLVLGLLVGSIAWYADAGVRGREADAMRSCETHLRLASDYADYRRGLTTNYVLPAAEGSGSGTHLADLMAPRARRVLPRAQRADDVCRRVSVRPWHFSLVARQHAATAYSGALVTLLQIVAAQGRGSFHDDATLLQLRAAAGLAGG
jgi:hypothetical protein